MSKARFPLEMILHPKTPTEEPLSKIFATGVRLSHDGISSLL
jgi:hypothetical protein